MTASTGLTLLVGFALGMKHATEADHVVAVSTLVSSAPGAGRGAWVGAVWGLGHLFTVFAAGSALVLLRHRMPPNLERALELGVALMLLVLGTSTLHKALSGQGATRSAIAGTAPHAGPHTHAEEKTLQQSSRKSGWGPGPFLVGMMHGLAGSAGLALLVLTTIPSQMLGLVYLFIFGLGAVAGMAALSALLGAPLGYPGPKRARLGGWLHVMRFAAGAASCILGVVLAHRALVPLF